MPHRPLRGDVWLVDLAGTRGREQAGSRPAVVISTDRFNQGPAELAIVLPVTSVDKRIAFHVGVEPPEGGLRSRSFVKPEAIRSISTGRLRERLGQVSEQTLEALDARLRVLLDL